MSSSKKLHHNTDSTLYLLNNTILKICSHRFKHVSVNEGKINQHFLTNPIQEHCGIILFYASIFQIEKVQCSESGRKKNNPQLNRSIQMPVACRISVLMFQKKHLHA